MPASQAKPITLVDHELKTNGYSVLSTAFSAAKEFHLIKQRFNIPTRTNPNNPYEPKIFHEKQLINGQNQDLLEYNNFCLNLIRQLGYKQYRLDSIFQTIDMLGTKHIAQQPHFDRIATLKFMLYANDLTERTGAFWLSPGSHIWTKESFGMAAKRPLHGSEGFLEASRNIPMSILDKLKPVEAKAGTIIIFNTDCIHHQGLVHSGQANIIRAHYRKPNPRQSPIKRLIQKLASKN